MSVWISEGRIPPGFKSTVLKLWQLFFSQFSGQLWSSFFKFLWMLGKRVTDNWECGNPCISLKLMFLVENKRKQTNKKTNKQTKPDRIRGRAKHTPDSHGQRALGTGVVWLPLRQKIKIKKNKIFHIWSVCFLLLSHCNHCNETVFSKICQLCHQIHHYRDIRAEGLSTNFKKLIRLSICRWLYCTSHKMVEVIRATVI